MADKVEGFLEVGLNDRNEIVVNHPDLKPDADGVGHIVFSPAQALNLAHLLTQHAGAASAAALKKKRDEEMRKAAEIPVDRSARILHSGQKESDVPDYRETTTSGMQKEYVILTQEERSKGFVRPVRRTYRHASCGTITTCSVAIAETYARDPTFYSGTFCVNCRDHFPLNQFVWEGTQDVLGT
jgi:hypothetical protein